MGDGRGEAGEQTIPQKSDHWPNLYKTEVMIISLKEMLELPIIFHVGTSTI